MWAETSDQEYVVEQRSLPKVLLLPEVLEKILGYTIEDNEDRKNLKTIDTCRALCPLWEEVSNDILTSYSWFSVEAKIHGDAAFRDYVNRIDSRLYKSFLCWLMPGSRASILFRKIGFQVQELQLRIGSPGSSCVVDLQKFLELLTRFCNNLKTLRLSFYELENSLEGRLLAIRWYPLGIEHLIVDEIGNGKQMKCLQRIIENSPRLKKLRFQTEERRIVEGVLRAVINSTAIQTLSELKLPRPTLEGTSSPLVLNYFTLNSWHLSSLILSVGDVLESKDVKRLLESLKGTLTSLEISFENCHGLWEEIHGSFSEASTIPLSLTKLKRLTISHVHCKSMIMLNALLLSSLTFLKFKSWDCGCSHDTLLHELLHSRDPGPLVNYGLTALTLHTFEDPSMFRLSPSPWSNVKQLEIKVKSSDVIQSIFQCMTSLETLDLAVLENSVKSWMSLFTGRRKATKLVGFRFDRPSIANLKKLKWLKITSNPRAKLQFSDIFIHHGLLNLPDLQYVELQYTCFSNIALEMLKSTLLPFCRLEFGC